MPHRVPEVLDVHWVHLGSSLWEQSTQQGYSPQGCSWYSPPGYPVVPVWMCPVPGPMPGPIPSFTPGPNPYAGQTLCPSPAQREGKGMVSADKGRGKGTGKEKGEGRRPPQARQGKASGQGSGQGPPPGQGVSPSPAKSGKAKPEARQGKASGKGKGKGKDLSPDETNESAQNKRKARALKGDIG